MPSKKPTAASVDAKVDALAEQIGGLVAALSEPPVAVAKAEPTKAKAKPAKVTKLAACHAVPGTKFGLTPEPRASENHYVSVITLHADGSPVMSSTTNAPRKPARVPVAVAAYLLTEEGQDALRAQVDSLA